MKTIQELLTLAETDEGKQQIRVMVAEACGFALVPWQGIDFYYFQPTEQARVLARDGEMTGASREYTLPPYHTSLNTIMPEVRKLDDDQRERFISRLCDLSGTACYDAFEWSIIEAEAIHHCIALLLTLQQP